MVIFGALGNLQHEKDKLRFQNIWLREQKIRQYVTLLQEFPSEDSWCTEIAGKKQQKLIFKKYILHQALEHTYAWDVCVRLCQQQ